MNPPPVSLPDVVLELDRPRRLRFDVNACAEIEDRSGKTLGVLLGRGLLSVGTMRWLVWGLLLHEEPNLQPRDAGALLQTHWFDQGKRLVDLAEPVNEAIERGQLFGPRKKDPAPEGNAPAEAADPTASATGLPITNPLRLASSS